MVKGITPARLLAVTSAAAVTLVLAVAAPAGNRPVHKVSVGVPDFCGAPPVQNPGCNANFSIEAQQLADGSVRGNYTDQFGRGNGGFHATVDCLYIQGKKAWVSGIIKSGWNVGYRVLTEVVDNGTSKKDPPDTISYSYAPYALTVNCTLYHPALIQIAVPKGQVKVS